MAEYIKREYAVDAVLDVYYDTPDIDLSGEKFEAAIRKIQAADVAPVRHGRWVKIEEHIVLTYNTYSPMTITSETCSECNVRSGFLGRKGYVKDNSCPNCGAKMDGERKDGGDDHAAG